jgi:hypothetical protein
VHLLAKKALNEYAHSVQELFPTSLLFEILKIKVSEPATVITGCEGLRNTHRLETKDEVLHVVRFPS